MIWRVYMYFVSSLESIISKESSIEILRVFGMIKCCYMNYYYNI